MAAALTAKTYGLKATVVIPTATSALVEQKLKALGAEVFRVGASWQEADAHCRLLLKEAKGRGLYVPPFDHPKIWEGNATLADEVIAQLDGVAPDMMILTVGGGGLLCGIAAGLPKSTEILAVETRGADSLAQALKAGKLVTLEKITSQAICLGARRVAETAFDIAVARGVKSLVVSDAEAAVGCVKLAKEEKVNVEMACGAGVAAIYGGEVARILGDGRRGKTVVLVVCGGSDVDVDKLALWDKLYKDEIDWA